jgi:penicillin amidase
MLPRTGLPLQNATVVHWDHHQIPFIEAVSDHDLALTLGLIHVHLRWTQMEIMRRIAQGRISELLGLFGLKLDRLLRSLHITRAVPQIVAAMPTATRDWAEAFVRGINHAVRHLPRVPPEFALLGLSRQEWTVFDIIGVGRLAAIDVTWLAWLALLRKRRPGAAEELWHRWIESGASFDLGSTEPANGVSVGNAALHGFARLCSNSWAVAACRSRSGAACIASDTHLPALLPNLFLTIGYRSPSYQAVGLMTPAIPAILLGRNPWIAWGGTNLHAASSDLFDVSHLEPARITERRERIRVRFARTREIVVRETELGPIISDLFPASDRRACSLRWMGHQPSDELTAMLAVNRARDWQEFRAATDEIGVPGQNMVYADVAGHIGKAMAVHLPMRRRGDESPLFLPTDSAAAWDRTVGGGNLSAVLDPAEGFVASANDRPPPGDVRVGYLFSADHRIKRLRMILSQSKSWDFGRLAMLQRDVRWDGALPFRDLMVKLLREQPAAGASRKLAEQLALWDGQYAASSGGALAFELLLFQLGVALHGRHRLALYSATWNARDLLLGELQALSPEILSGKLWRSSPAVLRKLRRFRTWGAMHRLQPRHVLAALPLVGGRYRLRDFAADGGSETVLKTAHPLSGRRHRAGLAATARHISDLSDPDRNWFALLGGQDGWADSKTVSDQVALWRAGEYVRVPLRPETARADFPYHTELRR